MSDCADIHFAVWFFSGGVIEDANVLSPTAAFQKCMVHYPARIVHYPANSSLLIDNQYYRNSILPVCFRP